jgi:hypothetical protein
MAFKIPYVSDYIVKLCRQQAEVTQKFMLFFLIRLVKGGAQLGPLGTATTDWLIVPAPVVYDGGEFDGMKSGKGNQSTRRKTAPAPQIPLD